jgi:Tol biopolymer transport system component
MKDLSWVDNRYPWWLSSSEILFARRTGSYRQIYKINIETNAIEQYFEFDGAAIQPSMSWENKIMAFVSLDLNTGLPAIFVHQLSNGEDQQVTPYRANLYYPRWAPDNQSVYANTQFDIWNVKISDGSQQLVGLGDYSNSHQFIGYMKAFIPIVR